MSQHVLELFKAVVVEEENKTLQPYTEFADRGIVLDFEPTRAQKVVILDRYKPLDLRTLFSVEERENAPIEQLLVKQIMHYIEVYGLGKPGLFDLEFEGGSKVSMTYIRGVTHKELGDMVRSLLYTNAPVKDSNVVRDIINEYKVSYEINLVANNELRVVLFDAKNDTFASGDDAVRWMCYKATESALLIKSDQVVQAVRGANFDKGFFERHKLPLAQVFNRHKRLIMAAKNKNTKSIINKISRLSKTAHVPVHEAISKRYLSEAVKDTIDASVLEKISIRDRFKFLNLLAYKRMGHTMDAFIVRNGKIHVAENRKVWSEKDIIRVETDVLLSLARDLGHLKGKNILLDARVKYGLPTSRKQAVGQLPFGTTVSMGEEAGQISSGIYWENDWGATDLDLSTIDIDGNRTGWGQYSGYSKSNPVTFSGDVTYAANGAMEFMTSKGVDYGLFVNIYSGDAGSEAEVVVGAKTGNKWIDDFVIREKVKLGSRGSVIGFVQDTDFIVYQGRLSSNYVSGERDQAICNRGTSEFWTVNKLFDEIGIKYDVDKDDNKQYNNNMSYKEFSYDKLEELLL